MPQEFQSFLWVLHDRMKTWMYLVSVCRRACWKLAEAGEGRERSRLERQEAVSGWTPGGFRQLQLRKHFLTYLSQASVHVAPAVWESCRGVAGTDGADQVLPAHHAASSFYIFYYVQAFELSSCRGREVHCRTRRHRAYEADACAWETPSGGHTE